MDWKQFEQNDVLVRVLFWEMLTPRDKNMTDTFAADAKPHLLPVYYRHNDEVGVPVSGAPNLPFISLKIVIVMLLLSTTGALLLWLWSTSPNAHAATPLIPRSVPVVKLDNGTFTGHSSLSGLSSEFLGIPFAEPP